MRIALALTAVVLKLSLNQHGINYSENAIMRSLLVIALLLLSPFSQASTVKLNYSVFFGYMKTMYKLDSEYVTTAFYLVDHLDKSQCTINNAQIQVDDHLEPILFESNGRLLPFYSDQHRKDGGVLVIDIDDNKTLSSCDLQITVMAKEKELDQLTPTKLTAINEQLTGVLKKNAGMIGKYFLPSFSGLRLQLADPLTKEQAAALSKLTMASDKQLLLNNNDFEEITKINELDINIVRITPWLQTK